MQDAPKAVWSIPCIFVAFFSSLKHNFIAYRSSLSPDCIFEIHQLWQSGFSRVYFNCCCSCWFEAEIIKIDQSYHKMYSNNIVDFQESSKILNASTKKSGSLLKAPRIYIYIYIYRESERERERERKKEWVSVYECVCKKSIEQFLETSVVSSFQFEKKVINFHDYFYYSSI